MRSDERTFWALALRNALIVRYWKRGICQMLRRTRPVTEMYIARVSSFMFVASPTKNCVHQVEQVARHSTSSARQRQTRTSSEILSGESVAKLHPMQQFSRPVLLMLLCPAKARILLSSSRRETTKNRQTRVKNEPPGRLTPHALLRRRSRPVGTDL